MPQGHQAPRMNDARGSPISILVYGTPWRVELDSVMLFVFVPTAVPTFVLGEKYGIVGAQELPVFEDVLLRKLGRSPKA